MIADSDALVRSTRSNGTACASRKQRVVIVGGGFGGLYTARHLEKELKRRDDFEIVLINRENYFVFQPMLAEIISGTIGLLDVVSPIRHIVPKTELHVREVEAIDVENHTITTSTGFHPHPHVLDWDHLVLAVGTVTDFRGMRGLPEHAFPFKNLADAIKLRNHIIRALEEAAIERHDADLRRSLLTFVVAGGGFSGVEVAAEVNDFVRHVAKSVHGIEQDEIRVTLIHGKDRILQEVDEQLALFAQRLLARRGVEIRLNARLAAATGNEAILDDGTRLWTKTLVSTVPASVNPLIESLPLPKAKNGRLTVDRSMAVEGATNVWALGDCALVPAADHGFAPPTAQHASRQASVVAANIVASIRGGPKRVFAFEGLGILGALGRHSAIAEILGVKISGFAAWFLWRTIYLMKIPRWARRLKVAVSWMLDLFLAPDLVQLRLDTGVGVTREHFEPDEEVFHQGDVGDRLYIIVRGSVEVWQETAGAASRVAVLGPGEYFGETALLEERMRNATLRCVEPTDVLSLPKQEFSVLTASLPDLRQSFEEKSHERSPRPRPADSFAR
ncbi:FAD-dependent oxidoreductase [Labilithrix luteola]|nr:FAD-dependent oxidoreductase [Labilithrix luteola]